MPVPNAVGSIAAICTTGAFVPQVLKVRRQGGEDLSYAMLGIYFVGVALWFVYGLMLHAPAMIWANAATDLLVAIAIFFKATRPGRGTPRRRGATAESEFAGD
jgi:MtN3 and saliva related transmembrane protein